MIGLRINNYEMVSILGEGGMGTVYLARHTFTGRKAAVKLLHPELARDATLVARFMNEARATTAIGHPNIIDIIDVGLLPDGLTPYLMMELLQGESLCKCLQRSRPLPIPEAIEIACQTAFALSAAHACDIVHRDLKPDNLFLVPDSSVLPIRLRVKVLDFGIAKLRGDLAAGSVKTRTGSLLGTPQYMSPEQCRGLAGQIDHRTDIYALGIIVYEMVCGSPPFVSEGLGDILMMHLHDSPAPPRTLNPDIHEALDAVILRALAKDRDQRFASMADFQQALRSAVPADTAGNGPRALAETVDATSPLPAPGGASESAALAPTQALEQESAASKAAPASASPAISWAAAPSTTFTSTVGQVLAAAREQARRRMSRARRAVLAGGVLVAAALVLYATVLHEGRQPPASLPSAAPTAPAATPDAMPVLPPPPSAVLPTGPPDAALPEAQAAIVVADKSRPATPKDQRRDKKGGKKTTVVAAPVPPVLPKAEAPPAPAPVTSPAIKPGERW